MKHQRLVALALCTGFIAEQSNWSAEFPLQVGATQRYLVDQTGTPFLIQADSSWSLIIALNNPEASLYLQDRSQKGFNAVLANLIEHQYNGGDNPNPSPINRYGQGPFLTPGDFSTPNEAYFTNADWVIDQAAARGIVVVLFPCYVGYPNTSEGWYAEMLANGTSKCQQFGQYVGNRYKNKPNIIWGMYGDRDPEDAQPMVDAVQAGIQSVDANHLFTPHLQRGTVVRTALSSTTWFTLNTSYTDNLTYVGAANAYATSPTMAVWQIENWYEGENGMTPASVRAEAYWADLSGACGQAYGNNPVWGFFNAWQAALDSVGANDMARVVSLFLSRPWHTLVPDAAHTVVTAGYGSGASFVGVARASDGATVIAYLPAGGTISMDLTKVSGAQAQAWWYNPRDGSSSNAGSYSTTGSQSFTAPTTADWVLVVDDSSRQFPLPGSANPPPLVVTTSTLANGTVGVTYTAQLTASGGAGAYSWNVVSGAVPPGLTVQANGLLGGTPSSPGTFNFTVRATDAGSTTADASLTLTINTVNTSPTVSAIANRTMSAGGSTGAIGFTVSDAETAAGSLVVSGNSSNPTLVPNIVFGGSGANRTVTVTPAAGQSGTATITVTVSDGQLSTSTNFVVTVSATQSGGLVAAYSFNEGVGTTATDASGNGNNGTLSGATWTPTGKFGGALSFNGSSRVMVPGSSTLDLTNRMTLEAWVYPTATATTWSTVVLKEQSGALVYSLYAGSPANRPSTWIYTTGEQGFSGPTALPINSWSHLAATYDGTTMRLYINGNQVASQAVSGNMVKSTGNLSIGGNGVWPEYFRGTIDDVRVYNRALSTSEIQSDMITPVGAAVNAPPTVSAIANQTIAAGGNTGAIGFTVGDAETAAGSLTVSGSSANPTLVPNGNIVFGGSGANRTVTVTPAAGQSGTATVTVSVSDGQLSASTNFVVTVTAANTPPTVSITSPGNGASVAYGTTISFNGTATDGEDGNRTSSLVWTSSVSGLIGSGGSFSTALIPGTHTIVATATDTVGARGSATAVVTVQPNTPPTVSAIANQTIAAGGSTGAIGFTVSDAETAAGSLTVSGSSANPTLVPNGNIVFGGSGANRTVTVTPAAGQSGTATITVSVSDGQLSTSTNFVVTVTAATATTTSFTNASSITIPDVGKGTPYPSTINVTGMAGTISQMTVTLRNLSHTWPDDVDMLLVGPGGQKVMIFSDAGAGLAINNVNVTLSDAAAAALPVSTKIASGTYKPTDYAPGDVMPTPAPVGPYGNVLSVFNGQPANGAWSLYVVDDGTGDQGLISGGWSVTITSVSSANTAPTLSGISNQTIAAGGSTGAIGFTVGDAETAAGSLTVSGSSANPTLVPNGNIVFGGSGANRTVTVTPAAGQSGTATVTVSVSDGQLSASTNFVVTVTAANTPPTVSITSPGNGASVAYGTTISFNGTATDGEDGNRTSSLVWTSSVSGLIGSGGSFSTALIPGTHTIVATATDTVGARGSATVVVTVQPNTAPTISAISNQTIAAGGSTGAIGFTVGDAETAAGSLTVSGSSANPTLVPNGNIVFGGSGANRTVTVTPAAGQSGTATVTVSVSDGQLSVSTNFVVTVTAANTPPTVSITSPANGASVAYGTTISFAGTATDLEDGNRTSSLVWTSSVSGLIGSGGSFSTVLIPGAHTITATATDTLGARGSATAVVTVQPNTPPTVSAIANQTIAAGGSTGAIGFTVSDAETAAGSLAVSGNSSNPTLVPNIVFGGSGANRTVTVTPAAGQSGTATVTVSVSDGQLSVSTNFVVTVTAANTPPTVSITSPANGASVAYGTTISFAGTATDLEDGNRTSSLVWTSSVSGLIGSGGSFSTVLIPGAHTITATATDTLGARGSATAVVTVQPNTPPTVSAIANQTIAAGGSTGAIGFTVSDAETAAGSLAVSGNSSNPTLVPNIVFGGSGANRTVTVTPAAGQSGTATVTVSVSDGQLSVSTNFVVTVTAATATTTSFTNASSITIPDVGKGTPYPSTINVTGMAGTIGQMTVTLQNLNHTWPDDVDMLLVGPGGQKVMIFSDAGAGLAINNVNVTLSDAAAAALPVSTKIASGTYKPTDYEPGDVMPTPAPVGPYGNVLSVFNGQPANGAWSLYVVDDGTGDQGLISGGWSVTITTVP